MLHSPKSYSGALVVVVLLGLAAPALAADVSGMVKSLNQGRDDFVLIDAIDRNWTFYLGKTAKIYLNDKQVQLSDLLPGDMATVTYEMKDGNNLMAVEVRCRRK